jgi:2Fe-2S ferredoxin
MAVIHFLKNNKVLEIDEGTNLREALIKNGIPVASSCGGVAVCAKCWVKVLQGEANLSRPRLDELRLQSLNNVASNIRLSCQVEILGSVTLDSPYW